MVKSQAETIKSEVKLNGTKQQGRLRSINLLRFVVKEDKASLFDGICNGSRRLTPFDEKRRVVCGFGELMVVPRYHRFAAVLVGDE